MVEEIGDRQSREVSSGEDGALVEGHLYAVNGGVFEATFDPALGLWQLWTYQGLSGQVIARTGFDVDAMGGLHDRIFDMEAEAAISLVPAFYTVADLQPVQAADCALMAQAEAQETQRDAADVDGSFWEL